MTTLNMRGQWSLVTKPIVVIDLLIYLAGCLVPMVVWTLLASLPIATAILEVDGRINYGLSAGFTILALILYSSLLANRLTDQGLEDISKGA